MCYTHKLSFVSRIIYHDKHDVPDVESEPPRGVAHCAQGWPETVVALVDPYDRLSLRFDAVVETPLLFIDERLSIHRWQFPRVVFEWYLADRSLRYQSHGDLLSTVKTTSHTHRGQIRVAAVHYSGTACRILTECTVSTAKQRVLYLEIVWLYLQLSRWSLIVDFILLLS